MIVGIVKSKTLNSGAVGEFWKISKVHVDLLTGELDVTLALYIDQAAYNSGRRPLSMSKVYKLTVAPSDLATDLRTMVWTKIKAKASTVITLDITGATIAPTAWDPDIDGGVDVTV